MRTTILTAPCIVLVALSLCSALPNVATAREYTPQEMCAVIDGFHADALRLKCQGRYDEAKAIFEKILFVEPHNPNATFDLGNVYLSEKRYKEALSYYKKARKMGLDPEFSYMYFFNSALAYAGLGYNRAAIHCLKRCIVLNADHKDTIAFLELMESAQGRKVQLGPIGDRFANSE